MMEEEIIALLRLQHTPAVGDITAKKLIAHCGSASRIFKEKKHLIQKIDGIGTHMLKNLFNETHQQAAENEWKYICENNISFCTFTDENYPANLKQTIDAPILFFHNGNFDLKHKKIISIVGTRQVTPHGIAFCEQFIEELAALKDLVIVSGFAYGVDIVAHKKSIEKNITTIACLAHGLDRIYPVAHKKYVEKIKENGGFITDFWHESNFDRKNFLSRNRIIAGLSDATIVIESAEKGGSLVTADIAFSYDREVFAVPGRPSDPYSAGCNDLIKRQKAQMITSASDFLFYMNWHTESKPKVITPSLFIELSPEEELIVNYLKENGKQSLDEISRGANCPIHKLSHLLFQLEMKGAVTCFPGKFFAIS